jgi:hypothetical protein
MKENKTAMRYIITSAQYNAGVNRTLLANIKNFAKKHKVDQILVFPMRGKFIEETNLSPDLLEFELVDKMRLNQNLMLKSINSLPQQIDPFFGLSGKFSRDYSHIIPSPKIRYKSIANNSKYPRALMTTGAITRPNYKMHTRIGQLANEQHQYGFVYVEVVNGTIFNARQIEATDNGDFYYLTEKYYNHGVGKAQPEALILGDWHEGDTCPKVRAKSIEMIKELKPKRVVFHDLFNGHSINHHEEDNLLAELRSIRDTRFGLEREMTSVYKELTFFANRFKNVEFVVVRSNHDDFLERYIKDKKFIKHPSNFLFCCKLIPHILDENKVPLEEGLKLIGEIPKNVRFLNQDESYRVRGVELGIHGHQGANGSKGSPKQYSKLNLRTITGHTHSPELMANGMVVGTSTKLKLSYTHGASSWLNAHGILYANGKYGLITLLL